MMSITYLLSRFRKYCTVPVYLKVVPNPKTQTQTQKIWASYMMTTVLEPKNTPIYLFFILSIFIDTSIRGLEVPGLY